MKILHGVMVFAASLLFVGAAEAADVVGFRSAKFGANEKTVTEAMVKDLGIKAGDIKRTQDPTAKIMLLSTKVKDFGPLNLPATFTYILGYKCNCLIRVSILWEFPEGTTLEQRKTAMIGVAALANRFEGEGWGKDEMVRNRALGEAKEGTESLIYFFRGQNKTGGAISLIGAPVKMVKADKAEGLSANIDEIKNVSLSYEKDAVNPDIYRLDVSGF